MRFSKELQEVASAWGLTPGQDILDLRGKIYITAVGILRHAHSKTERPLRSVRVSDPSVLGDTLYIKCTVEVLEPDGSVSVFEGLGDSFSTPKQIPPIRMAETRAKARALRTAYAIPFTGLEEMGEDVQGYEQAAPAANPPPPPRNGQRQVLERLDSPKKDRLPPTRRDAPPGGMPEEEKPLGREIHALRRERGLGDYDEMKKMMGGWSMQTAGRDQLRAVSGLLKAEGTDALKNAWGVVVRNSWADPATEALKDHLKAFWGGVK